MNRCASGERLYRASLTGLASVAALLVTAPGCAPASSPPVAAGAYQGTYEVPTDTASLSDAAIYDVPKVEWKVDGASVELAYDLPLGLVGKKMSVKLSGAADGAGATFTLTGEPGTATCEVSGGQVSCNETMNGLLPLDPDYAVVEELAKAEYAGPPQLRVEVARRFAAEPIGVLRTGVTAPSGEHEGG